MKKQAIKKVPANSKFPNVRALPKNQLSKVKGGNGNGTDDTNYIGVIDIVDV